MLLDYYGRIDHAVGVTDDGKILRVDPQQLRNVVSLFSDSAVYEREDWGAIAGKHAIGEFFLRQRPLQGEHRIDQEQVVEASGLPGPIRQRVLTHFPELDASRCETIIVPGIFHGNHYVTDSSGEVPGHRAIKLATEVVLKFKDYWIVVDDDEVVFRLSEISPVRAEHREHQRCDTPRRF